MSLRPAGMIARVPQLASYSAPLLWLNDGCCIRLRPGHRNHVWSYDFVEAQTHDGRKVRLMTLIDEFTRQCLAIRVARRINNMGVIKTMADAMIAYGVPEHIRSDNGPEMTAKIARQWLGGVGAKTLYIEPGSPWENGYCESFNGKLRDEMLNNRSGECCGDHPHITPPEAVEAWKNSDSIIKVQADLAFGSPRCAG